MTALFNEKVLKNEIPTNKMILYPSDIEDVSQNEMNITKDPGTSILQRSLHTFLIFR